LTLLDKISETPLFQQKRSEKSEKKTLETFFVIFPNQFIFLHKIFPNFLYPLKIENKHIEVENQFLFKLRKSFVVFQWLYLPSGLYNLISFPVRNIIRRCWSVPTQLIPEISLDPLRIAESSLKFSVNRMNTGNITFPFLNMKLSKFKFFHSIITSCLSQISSLSFGR